MLGSASRGNSGVPSLRLPGTLWRERSEQPVGCSVGLFGEQSHLLKRLNRKQSSSSNNSWFLVPGSGNKVTASRPHPPVDLAWAIGDQSIYLCEKYPSLTDLVHHLIRTPLPNFKFSGMSLLGPLSEPRIFFAIIFPFQYPNAERSPGR